jgi:hypothetical protein
MRIHTCTVWDIETGAVLSDECYEYSGPLALADRSVQSAAKSDANQAGTTAGGFGSAALGIAGPLTGELQREAANPIGYTPEQTNSMLVAGEQGAGGANASIAGTAGLAAGRTRNSAALSGVLDAAARAKTQQLSQNALNVQNKSADVGLQRQAQAQQQLQGLYGTNVNAQLKSMGLQNEDLNTELAAGRQGWLQNTEGVLDTLGGLGSKAADAAAQF